MPSSSRGIDSRKEARELLRNIRTALPELKRLHDESNDHGHYEDPIYRFYHQSFKVYHLQHRTEGIVAALRALAPERELNEWFAQIVRDGTGREFDPEHNSRWLEVTRPIVEAFFHARYFLEMAVRYGKELRVPPQSLPSGWAALLCLYGLR